MPRDASRRTLTPSQEQEHTLPIFTKPYSDMVISKETVLPIPCDYESATTLQDYTSNEFEGETTYTDLIQHQIQPFFPKFAAALDKQSPQKRDQGWCAIDLDDAGQQRISKYTTATQLRASLAEPSQLLHPISTETPQCRRLFILEDLPYDYIITLGSLLRISPNFFASRWHDPSALAFNLRSPFESCSLPCFRLHYATSYRVVVDAPTTSRIDSIYAFKLKG